VTQLPRAIGVKLCFFIFMAESEIILDQSAIESILAKMAKEIVEQVRNEIALYRKYKSYYSYGFYLAKKVN